MNLLTPEPSEITAALSWLTTAAFDELPKSVLAVVLADERHDELVRGLQDKCKSIDASGSALLILSLGVRGSPVNTFNPDWSFEVKNVLRQNIAARRHVWSGRHLKTHTGSFACVAARLLNVDPKCLPALFLRFQEQSERPATAVVVPLRGRAKRNPSRLLHRLSWAADDMLAGEASLSAFLEEEQLFGWVVTPETQRALDEAFAEAPARSTSGSQEAHRVAQTLHLASQRNVSGLFRTDAGALPAAELLRAVEEFLCPTVGSKTKFYRPDLVTAIQLAGEATAMGDPATVARNIGAVLESTFTASMLHLVRGSLSVRLPAFVDHVDPACGVLRIGGVRMNKPRFRRLGLGPTVGLRDPWEPPAMAGACRAFEAWLGEHARSSVDCAQAAELVALLLEASHLRNPAAHGGWLSRSDAAAMWEILGRLVLDGHLAAMSAVRTNLATWPHPGVPRWNRPSRDNSDAYQHAIRDLEEARTLHTQEQAALRERTTVLAEAHRNRNRLEDLPSEPSSTVETLRLQIQQFLGLGRDVEELRSALPPDLTEWIAAEQKERKQKRRIGRRVIPRLFTTVQAEDRAALAAVGRPLKVWFATPDGNHTVDAVLDEIAAVVESEHRVQCYPGVDWRAGLEEQLHAYLAAKQLRRSFTPASFDYRVVLELRQQQNNRIELLEAQAQEQSQVVDDALARKDCAQKRLVAARRGSMRPCSCGNHGGHGSLD